MVEEQQAQRRRQVQACFDPEEISPSAAVDACQSACEEASRSAESSPSIPQHTPTHSPTLDTSSAEPH
ncbi:hypothetical protein VTN77DRAFT_4007 [Rasamsonia byssochlamydoides]|uniref:uncharacterized protein n=1 Tax=Rasamsonia byssochlamydoides TaxID=89139 RepID=UPI003744608B